MWAARCECGTHTFGIYAYNTNGEGCCSSVATAVAYIHYYELNEGVWENTGSTQITGTEAQNHCCGFTLNGSSSVK